MGRTLEQGAGQVLKTAAGCIARNTNRHLRQKGTGYPSAQFAAIEAVICKKVPDTVF